METSTNETNDWLVNCLNERERLMYRIAITNAKDAEVVDQLFYFHFAKSGTLNSQQIPATCPLEIFKYSLNPVSREPD